MEYRAKVLLFALFQVFICPPACGSTACHLPSGATALCVSISQCGHITTLIGNLQKPLPRDVALLIRESFFCGNKNGRVFVCCPIDGLVTPAPEPQVEDKNECGLQNDLSATCVLYSKCSPFVEMMANLRKPLPPAVPSIVRSSYLCGVQEVEGRKFPKVCCPTEALNDVKPLEPPPKEVKETITNRYGNHPGKKLLSNDASCGVALGARIVGGQNADLGQYPWLVNLGYKQKGRPGTLYKCGGTLIGARYVLTAAHCVTQLPRSFSLATIRVGEHDLKSDKDCTEDGTICTETPQDFDVEKVIFHESYGKPKPFQNDIAIIKLSRDVIENDFASPVCIPFNDDTENYATNRFGGEEVETTVAGWGATTGTGRNPATILQYLAVNVTDSQACKKIYAERGGVLTPKQICAGGTPGRDSCVGDSGSGLMRDLLLPSAHFPKSYLIGVVSFGPRMCGTKGVPGVYTRVNSYLDWILDTVNDSN
eukprot:GFUD01129556.1.p1 GENE.GFUD01129556.1~~GFUD01129556.1.p1  ORF type:complete len:481 (+),score=114.68 GFUD01129556.1:36-1478(+)